METRVKETTARAFAGENDVAAMGALIAQARPPAWQGDYPTTNDLRELLAESVVRKTTRLWHDAAGALVAYALLDEANNLVFDGLPTKNSPVPDAEMVAWGVHWLRQRRAQTGARDTLDASCRVEDTERIARLEQFGFTRQPNETLRMERDLRETIPPAILPQGLSIRTVTGVQEAQALAELHRAAFGTAYMTAEKRLEWMRAPQYDPSLDLVVAASGGQIAAYCFGRIDPVEIARTGRAVGWLDPLATHPDYQGSGLARALLVHGLQLLRARGMDYAALGTGTENIAMQRAASAAGFRVDSQRAWFSKQI